MVGVVSKGDITMISIDDVAAKHLDQAHFDEEKGLFGLGDGAVAVHCNPTGSWYFRWGTQEEKICFYVDTLAVL